MPSSPRNQPDLPDGTQQGQRPDVGHRDPDRTDHRRQQEADRPDRRRQQDDRRSDAGGRQQ